MKLFKFYAFTERQREIIKLIMTPKSLQEIADELGLKYDNLQFHLTKVYRTVGLPRRGENRYKLMLKVYEAEADRFVPQTEIKYVNKNLARGT